MPMKAPPKLEFIKIPPRTRIVWPIDHWERGQAFELPDGILICCLHRSGTSNFSGDFGFVLSVERGGLVRAYNKVIAGDGARYRHINYTGVRRFYENEMDKLSDQPLFSTNEVWVRSSHAAIDSCFCPMNRGNGSKASLFTSEAMTHGYRILHA